MVVAVEAASLTDVASLNIRDEAGRLWAFKAEGFVGFSPSHLREHQAFGHPVTVRYRETADGLVAVSITD